MSDWLMEGIPRNIAENQDMETVERIRASIHGDNGQTLESSMLLPCPFCGGEAHFIKVKHVVGIWYTVCCDDAECFGHEQSRLYTLRRLAAEAWNRRAERTCRVEVERRKLSQTQTAVVKSCSECGFEFGVEKENTFPFEVTPNAVVPPSYCPNCGARVEVRR